MPDQKQIVITRAAMPIEASLRFGDSRLNRELGCGCVLVKDLAQRLRDACRTLPMPDQAAPFENTYCDVPADLALQLEGHLAYVAACDGGEE